MRNPYKIPRKAYCNGCDHTFEQMHILRNHRRTDACGGRFLDLTIRRRINILRMQREEMDRVLREARRGR